MACDPSALPILIVDDEETVIRGLSRMLQVAGFDSLIGVRHGREVTEILKKQEVGVVLLDLTMPDLPGQQILVQIHEKHPALPVIIVTGDDTLSTAVECMKTGAADYLVKPVHSGALVAAVTQALDRRGLIKQHKGVGLEPSGEPRPAAVFSKILTQNARMKSIFEYMRAVAPTERPVLITGETGVGKELIAEALHGLSGRQGRYIPINIASFDETMFSDTLFGHRKGAFTGAAQAQEGLVAAAAGGTLFLDEIGELSQICQVKLLRLLESGEYLPLGSSALKRSKARIVIATNRNLERAVESGGFRKDLYYRLRTHHVHVPPLRERLDDLPVLVGHFVPRAAGELGKEEPEVPPEVLRLLERYSFPGNIRELESMIYEAVSSNHSPALQPGLFRAQIDAVGPRITARGGEEQTCFPGGLPTISQLTEQLIEEALQRAHGNQTKAAKLLGITQQALSSRLRRRNRHSSSR
jgi:two-component system nitrogen regulation response regulator GlnG